MRTTIDKAGRVVIPRALRERVGLADGGEVDVEVDGSAIRLEAVSGSEVVQEGRFVVIPRTGSRISAEAVRQLIDEDRHGRG